MSTLEQAEAAYLASVFGGDDREVERCLATLEGSGPAAELARGKLLHCLNLPQRRKDPNELACFVRAADGYQAEHDRSGLATAMFWQGCYHQVLCDDARTAVRLLKWSLAIATDIDDRLTTSYCLRHLAIADHTRGDLDEAERRLTESTELPRQLGFVPGVAANLVGLSYLSLDKGDRRQAELLAGEAIATARSANALRVLADAEAALESVRG